VIDETRAQTPEEAHDEHLHYLFFRWGQESNPKRRAEFRADYINYLRREQVSEFDALEGK
jgi:hypothetical protein